MNYVNENIINRFKDACQPDKFIKGLDVWRQNHDANLAAGHFGAGRPLTDIVKYYDKSLPVLLVGASPHLDDNIDQIAAYQSRLFIIACDVTLPALLRADIIPDAVVAIDHNAIIARSFDGQDTTLSSLICPTTIHPNVIRAWKGDIYYFCQSDIIRYKDVFLRNLNRLHSFPYLVNRDFVGATAYQVARMLNPERIILIGYGFSYLDKRIYCRGVYESRGVPKYTVDADTSDKLLGYLKYFHYISRDDDRIINCTEGGLLNKNNMPLSDALKQYVEEGHHECNS